MTLQEAKEEIIKLVQEHDGDEKEARTAYFACLYLLDQVKEEPVGNPDKMTLKELARELRKVFRFRYLTAHRSGVEIFLRMYAKEPSYFKTYSVWGETYAVFFPIAVSEDLSVDLDLSEYKDENGEIDYSKCIVEVE